MEYNNVDRYLKKNEPTDWLKLFPDLRNYQSGVLRTSVGGLLVTPI